MNNRALKQIARQILPGWLLDHLRDQMEFNRLRRKPPELMWKVCARAPEGRIDATGVRIGHEFFMIGGFETMDRALSVVNVFDLKKRRWTERFGMPADAPQTHLGRACDGRRFIYLIGGQLGPQCHPCVGDCFVLDVRTRSWSKLPPLPEPRYSPTMCLWQGRVHVVSGAKPDRWTSAFDHWSLAVAEGKALECQWREEVPIPKGGPHRTSVVCNDRLYVFGGQEGDVKPIAGDSKYRCDWGSASAIVYGDSFVMARNGKQWESIAPMPTPSSHAESEIVIDHYAVIVGGGDGHRHLSDLIQVYDVRKDRWHIAGRLPYHMKTTSVYYDGWLYAMTGQRSVSRTNVAPGEILSTVWRARFNPRHTVPNA